MQIELVRLQENVGITFIIVTHDQKEALSMANRIAVMGDGKILQIASPKNLYEYPTSSFVADFIGQVNLFEINNQQSSGEGLTVGVAEIGDVLLKDVDSRKKYSQLAIRPEKISVSREQPDTTGLITLSATLQDISYIGDQSHLYFETSAGTNVSVSIQNREIADQYIPRRGENSWLCWHPSHLQPLTS